MCLFTGGRQDPTSPMQALSCVVSLREIRTGLGLPPSLAVQLGASTMWCACRPEQLKPHVVAEVTRSPLWKCSPPDSVCLLFTVFVIDCQSVAFNSSAGRVFLKMPV